MTASERIANLVLGNLPPQAAIRLRVSIAEDHPLQISDFEIDRLGNAPPTVTVWRTIFDGARPVGQISFEAGVGSGPSALSCLMRLTELSGSPGAPMR